MPTITANAILTKAKTLLQDTTSVRWGDAELLGWLNDGQRAVAMLRPDVSSKLVSLALVAGTRQSIPADGTAVMRVVRNMGAGGTTPGRAVRHVPMELLDSNLPGWHTVTPSAEILHAAVDVRVPRTFYVYPPATAGTQVELMYAAPPADVGAVGDTITIDDVFSAPLVDYVCFRAYSKDQDMSGNAERATAHFQLFTDSLNGKAQADSVMAVKANVKG